MSESTQPNPYAIPLSALEDSAHVPFGDQIEEQPEPPAPDFLDEQQSAQQRLLRIAAG